MPCADSNNEWSPFPDRQQDRYPGDDWDEEALDALIAEQALSIQFVGDEVVGWVNDVEG